MTTELTVPDMSCGHCKATVERALLELEGVDRALVDLDAKTVVVEHADGIDVARLSAAVSDAGYAVTSARGGNEPG